MDLLKQRTRFDSEEFRQEFHCDTPLGSFCAENGTMFRLWAPTAEKVVLYLYAEGIGGRPTETIEMVRGERGLWIYETQKNLDGTYYDFHVTVNGDTRRTADPYARACGINGSRSMVLDLRRTDPEGWQDDRAPMPKAEQVIYELHVKDFSWDEAGGFDPADRGKFTALCRTGTTLRNEGEHPTGLDYLKRLGVTHVQLLPIYDYGSVDEAGPEDRYNWGYDPVNYNIPEGGYSSDPFHGEVRVRELKAAIQALHSNGFRVIMDVVYNHTYSLDSWLFRVAPWYYYRQKSDGTASDGSGCGDDLSTERSMCAKYILDSILYWTEEYHIDGFRFDLMGLMDVDLMNRIQAALDARFGVGEKLVYGEPWRGGTAHVRPGTILADKAAMKLLDPQIGAFCDDTRDAIKGSLMDEHAVGFVNGGYISPERLRKCVAGWAVDGDSVFQSPAQTITYLSCHDDWTLWDKLTITMDPERRFQALNPDVLRANRMAAAINFCCQGRPFFLAGEEFGRTKGGVKNSFRSDVRINQLDWSRAWENAGLVDYYRGLIALRMQLPALQDKTVKAGQRILSSVELAPNCVGVSLDNADGTTWDKVIVICNANREAQQVNLPAGTWQILTDGENSFRWQMPETVSGTTRVEPVSVLIVGRIAR